MQIQLEVLGANFSPCAAVCWLYGPLAHEATPSHVGSVSLEGLVDVFRHPRTAHPMLHVDNCSRREVVWGTKSKERQVGAHSTGERGAPERPKYLADLAPEQRGSSDIHPAVCVS